MASRTTHVDVLGPWSLATSRRFWEGFTPAALERQDDDGTLCTAFCTERDWCVVEVAVTQEHGGARIRCTGDGDLDAAAEQVARMLAIDVDGSGWPGVGERDPVLADAQRRLPGLRPCGFHSPYEAAAWSVLSQRIRMSHAARLRADLTSRYGEHGAFPAPRVIRDTELDLPGRKPEYLRAVAEAAQEGLLDGGSLRAVDPAQAARDVQQIKGLGPFAAELVVLRGANAPDAVPSAERRLEAQVAGLYGAHATLENVAEAWRPFRTWAAVHLRVLAEQR